MPNRNPPRALLYLRSVLYALVLTTSTFLYGVIYMLTAWLPYPRHYRVARQWGRFNVNALKVLCRLELEVENTEYIPDQPSIIFAKHQSVYEILALMMLLGPTSWVAKKELLKLPVFGWAFSFSKPITIDRKAGRTAIEQLVAQGRQALDEGRNVLIFPEGTRKAPGSPLNYRIGGAVLAAQTGYPVVPVAVNAGEFWPRLSLIKWPGVSTMVFGPAIDSRGKTAEQIRTEARDWIEAQMERISDPGRWNR